MLWTISVILLVLWAVGLVSAYTMGGFIHVLLVLAVIVICPPPHPGPRATRRGGSLPQVGNTLKAPWRLSWPNGRPISMC